MKFTELSLSRPIERAIVDAGYQTATPIQAQAIPHVLNGRDVLGCAQTGTGKTAAFALPILDRLSRSNTGKGPRRPRALVLAPTRELAEQIAVSFQEYGAHTDVYGTMIFGGVGQGTQVKALRRGVDVIVATPGRLLDLINQGHCNLSTIQMFVLDEADRMMDMGFMPDIKRIISYLPNKKQTLLFSATMPKEIRALADNLLHHAAQITIAPEQPAVERIAQSVYHVDKPDKPQLLAELIQTVSISRAIVFTRTKYGADRVVKQLKRTGTHAIAIHGDKSQNARREALGKFKDGRIHVLVATDIAARGIDVDNISHVINYDIAREAENHVHRIGRTARAGADGAAISLCDREEIPFLRAIERLLRKPIDVVGEEPAHAKAPPSGKNNRRSNSATRNARPTGGAGKPRRFKPRGRPNGKPGEAGVSKSGKRRRRQSGGKRPA